MILDPVEGGSANDYDYCFADPINCYDLDGQIAFVLVPVAVISVKGIIIGAAFVAGAVGAWYGGRATGRYWAKRDGVDTYPNHEQRHSSKKRARERAQHRGKGKPLHHPNPRQGDPHYHPTDAQGKKIPGTHDVYPR